MLDSNLVETMRDLWHQENDAGEPLLTVAEIAEALEVSYGCVSGVAYREHFRRRSTNGSSVPKWREENAPPVGSRPETDLIEAARMLWHQESDDEEPLLSTSEISRALEIPLGSLKSLAFRKGFRKRLGMYGGKPAWA